METIVVKKNCSWLQAAQDFREKQDKQDGGKLRKSYRIRLGITCFINYHTFCFC